MKMIRKRIFTLFLTLTLLLALCAPAAAVPNNRLDTAMKKCVAYLTAVIQSPQVGSVGGEWAVIGLARSCGEVPPAYGDGYYAAVAALAAQRNGVLHARKYTEYSRVVLALTALGADPTDVAGYDLLSPLGDFDQTVWQGINGPVWALIALDAGDYEMPLNPNAATQATRQMYVDEILSRQLGDGGWSLSGGTASDPDITGMALQALSKYQGQPAVKRAIENALNWLSEQQNETGGFGEGGSASAESAAQVLVALCELGINWNDRRFVKNGRTLVDALLEYQREDGSFAHVLGGASDQMATEQGFYALVAAWRIQTGKSSLYRMSDVRQRSAAGRMPDFRLLATKTGVKVGIYAFCFSNGLKGDRR